MPKEDPLEAMKRAAAAEGDRQFRGRLENEEKKMRRYRRIRMGLRWAIIVVGLLTIPPPFFFDFTPLLGGLTCIGIFLMFTAAAVLFFMGGIAPDFARDRLSKKQRRKLDN